MKRALIWSATLLSLAACSTNHRLLAPDHEAARLISPAKPATVKGRGADPVCGAPLDRAGGSWHLSYQGSEYYFDSEECRKQFEANPEVYRIDVR